MFDYATARDLFDAARDAALDADRIGSSLRRAEAACGLRGHAPTGLPGGRGGTHDPMAPVDRREAADRRIGCAWYCERAAKEVGE